MNENKVRVMYQTPGSTDWVKGYYTEYSILRLRGLGYKIKIIDQKEKQTSLFGHEPNISKKSYNKEN